MTALRHCRVAADRGNRRAAEIVERFLVASMVPDPETAARYIAAELKITFTGGRKYGHPRETAAFNAGRYKWVKKKMERTDVVAGDGETIVYNLGTLYGEWPDGTPFEGNRYVDRFVVRGGKIVQMDVWNDSAERLLDSARHRRPEPRRRSFLAPSRASARLMRGPARRRPAHRAARGACATAVWMSARPATASRCSSMIAAARFGIAAGKRLDDGAMLADRAFR